MEQIKKPNTGESKKQGAAKADMDSPPESTTASPEATSSQPPAAIAVTNSTTPASPVPPPPEQARKDISFDDFFDAVESVKETSPLSYELGKSLLTQTLESGREYCKTMIPVSAGAIGAYAALISFAWPKDAGVAKHMTSFLNSTFPIAIAPVVLLILAIWMFILGYFPLHNSKGFNGSARNRIKENLVQSPRRRFKFHFAGSLLIVGAIVVAFTYLHRLSTEQMRLGNEMRLDTYDALVRKSIEDPLLNEQTRKEIRFELDRAFDTDADLSRAYERILHHLNQEKLAPVKAKSKATVPQGHHQPGK